MEHAPPVERVLDGYCCDFGCIHYRLGCLSRVLGLRGTFRGWANRRKLGPQDQALERDLELSPLLVFLFAFQPPSDEQSVLAMPPATMTHHRP